jgi:hypothetical protein
MENLITLITVCSRPQYLGEIYESILSQKYNNFKWIISFDAENPVICSIEDTRITSVNYKNKKTDMTNYAALNNIFNNHIKEDTYIHIVDDDNILYPNYLNTINDIINNKPTLQFILYDQQYRNGLIRFKARTKEIRQGHVDTAQVCFHSSLINQTRFVQDYTGDGIFYKELFNKIKTNKSNWIVVNKVLCYYNYIVNSTKLSVIINQRNRAIKLIQPLKNGN